MSAIASLRTGAAQAPLNCFHCDSALPDDGVTYVEVGGRTEAMCCPGCAAVATLIEQTGMSGYYRARSRPAQRPAASSDPTGSPGTGIALALFDDPLLQGAFVERFPDGDCEAHLQLHHLRCGACSWLIEHQLQRQDGVRAVHIHPLAGRLILRWQADRTRLSELVAALRAVGYDASPWEAGAAAQQRTRERRRGLAELVVAGLGMMQVMMYAIPVYLADSGDMSAGEHHLMDWAGLVLTLPVLLFSARGIFLGAWRGLRGGHPGMDVPVALGLLAAFGGSLGSLWSGSGPVWFDSITMFVFLLLGTRWLERSVRERAADASNRLAPAVPTQTLRIDAGSGHAVPTAVVALRRGDRVRIPAGAAIPADGRVVAGAGPVAEAVLTGESTARWRQPGDPVLAGSLNLSQVLDVEVDAVGQQATLSRVLRRMDQALAKRPPLARLADLAASRFVTVLLALTLMTWLYWRWTAPAQALGVAIAVLVVSCPCALSLAVPATLAASAARLARRGLLLLDGDALEILGAARTVVFDKTGTLTAGSPQVEIDWGHTPLAERPMVGAVVMALEAHQNHPFAAALRADVTRLFGDLAPAALEAPMNHLGQGVEGRDAGLTWRIGKRDFALGVLPDPATPGSLATAQAHASAGDPECADGAAGSEAWLTSSGGHRLRFRFCEQVRPGAAELVRTLRARNIQVAILSGDHPTAVARLAAGLGIDDARGGLVPEQKQDAILALRATGPLVMVGDGLNDAPGFGTAHLAIAVGDVSAALLRGAGALLPSGDLAALSAAVGEAQGARARIRQNLAWAFAYNLCAIPVAACGWLTPWQAGLGMSLSSLLVVLNGMRPWKS